MEPWEAEKTVADMEEYSWEDSPSQKNMLDLLARLKMAGEEEGEEVREQLLSQREVQDYKDSVTRLKNEGDNEDTMRQYKEAVKNVLSLWSPRRWWPKWRALIRPSPNQYFHTPCIYVPKKMKDMSSLMIKAAPSSSQTLNFCCVSFTIHRRAEFKAKSWKVGFITTATTLVNEHYNHLKSKI